jgi:hypothetical protein
MDWTKRATCIHAFRAQLVAFGHAPPPVPVFRTPQGALRALRKAGYRSMMEMVDAMLPGARIPPSRMIVGDIALLPGEDPRTGERSPLDAAVIHSGGSKLLGWRGDGSEGFGALEIWAPPLAAWRLDCPGF